MTKAAAGGSVSVEPLGAVIDSLPGETIIEAARRSGYSWPSICGGEGSCRTCFVTVLEGFDALSAVDSLEQRGLDDLYRSPRNTGVLRLACQARPLGPVRVKRRGVRKSTNGPVLSDPSPTEE
jgi:2Fe-2S ferredoxin